MWDLTLTVEIDGTSVGVGCVGADAAAAVRSSLADLFVDVDPLTDAPTFGITTAKVGLRRREVAMLYHGRRIRHRAGSAQDAAAFLATLVEPNDVDGLLSLPLRVFTSASGAVLVDCRCSEFIDELALARQGILQMPMLTADVDVDSGTVRTPSGMVPVVGLTVTREQLGDTTDALNHFAGLAGDRPIDWAWLIDRLQSAAITTEFVRDGIESAIVAARR